MRRVKNLVDATFNFKESADVCPTLEESLLPDFCIKYVFFYIHKEHIYCPWFSPSGGARPHLNSFSPAPFLVKSPALTGIAGLQMASLQNKAINLLIEF